MKAKKYYGIWGDDGMTDEEFVEELKLLRNFNRDMTPDELYNIIADEIDSIYDDNHKP
jgi:hypothetical protein